MMRYWIIFIFLLASAPEANSSITVGQFLQQAREDAGRLCASGLVAERYGSNSWIERAEIRYSDDNDPNDKRSLALRLEPKGFGQKSAEDSILSLRQKQRGYMCASALNDVLQQRYEQLLELLSEKLLVHKLEQQIALSMDERKLQHELAYTKDFRPEDLLQLELHVDQLRSNMQSHRERLRDARARLHINRLPENMVTIAEMQAVISATPELQTGGDVQAVKLELEMAQQQYKLDRAKRGVALSLLEFKQERAARKNDVLGVTLGIRIPFGASFPSSQRAHDVADAMLDLQLQQRTHQRNLMVESDMLNWHKMQADAIKQTLNGIVRRIQPIARSGDTELLLALKRQQLAEQEKLADIHHGALRHYFNYLSITGRLAEAPLRNWLISGQPVL